MLHQKNTVSQRELSHSLSISLGTVNANLKKMARKGLILNESSKTRSSSYRLTGEGLAEKRRLTLQYWRESLERYSEIREKIEALLLELKAEGHDRIAFYGATHIAEIAYLALLSTGLHFAGIFDENKIGETFLNHRVFSPDRMREAHFAKILVTKLHNGDDDYCRGPVSHTYQNQVVRICFESPEDYLHSDLPK